MFTTTISFLRAWKFAYRTPLLRKPEEPVKLQILDSGPPAYLLSMPSIKPRQSWSLTDIIQIVCSCGKLISFQMKAHW